MSITMGNNFFGATSDSGFAGTASAGGLCDRFVSFEWISRENEHVPMQVEDQSFYYKPMEVEDPTFYYQPMEVEDHTFYYKPMEVEDYTFYYQPMEVEDHTFYYQPMQTN